MRKFSVSLILSLFVVLMLNSVSANPTDFPEDGTAFLEKLSELMNKSKREDSANAIEQLTEYYSSKTIPEEQLQEIRKVCNTMQEKRMRMYPHFTNYIETINTFAETGKLASKFDEWHPILGGIIDKISKGRFREFEDYLEFSNVFFKDNLLFKTSGKSWKVEATEYFFTSKQDTPIVSFEEVNLMAFTTKDTLRISKTRGDYYPTLTKWVGNKGTANWERNDIGEGQVYASFEDYEINTSKSEYTVENAMLTYPEYFNQKAIKGKFTDKLSTKINKQFLYPEFESHDLDLKMDNFAPQTKFKGGFGLRGPKVIGFGNSDKKASLDFYSEDGRKVMNAKANSFALKESSEVNSKSTSVSLYFAEDSIFHPSLNLKYQIGDKELRLVRDGKASSKIAFMSSYHQLEANVDAITWKINTPVVDFSMVTQLKDNRVVFESFNLYDEDRLNKYRMVTDIDPVAKLKEFSDGGQYQVEADYFAKYLNENYSVSSILSSIFDMVEDGFIYYDAETDMITIREKTDNYMEAKKGAIDFDRIMLVSETDKENAQLDLDTKVLLVTGIESIALSDSQKVTIYPANGITRVHRNRDMEVDGGIIAGNVDFNGKDFKFEYDPFKVEMDSIANMLIYVEDESGTRKTYDNGKSPIETSIQDVSGTLYIDEENNKSGKEDYPSYPRFESVGNSFLYYDRKKLYDGAYKRDSFYFKMDPFKFEDLDEITVDQIIFDGTMITGEIFPPIDQKARLQEDFSLGFQDETPANGLPCYKRGEFTGSLKMSLDGLTGRGTLNYMAGTMNAQHYLFLPDSMMVAEADTFYMPRKVVKGIEFPSAYNGKVRVKWLPKREGMYVYMGKAKKQFRMFEERLSLKGNLLITEQGLKGKGTMNWEDASLRSNEFTYKSGSFAADSSDVVIKNQEASKVAFNSYNVQSKIDVDNMLGEFKSNGENIPIVLPYTQYKTLASEFYWIINEKLINIRMPEDEESAYFESTNEDQGGLKFKASGGVVNLVDNTVKVDGIPFIKVADAMIRPQNTQVVINPNAIITPLENAMIVCDTTNEYHKISKANVKIKSINEFEGSGEYKYRGKGVKRQKIFFDNITTKEIEEGDLKGRYYTYATTNFDADKNFKLNQRINYKGDAILDGRTQFLVFDGFAKIDLISSGIVDAQWFAFKDEINPDNISIDVSTPIGERGDTLSFGFVQDMDLLSLYPTFLTKKRTPLDEYVFVSTGDLIFDDEAQEYQVASKERLDGTTDIGNKFILRDEKGIVEAEGKFTMGSDYGLVDLDLAGHMIYDSDSNTFKMENSLLGVNFHFNKDLLEDIGESIRYFNSESEEIDFSKETFMNAGLQLVNEKQVEQFRSAINQYGYMPEKYKGLDQSLIITDLNLVFDTISRTFISDGPFGVAFTGEQYVNRMVKGHIEFGVRRSGDFFNIYFETEKDDEAGQKWYFFNYKKGMMRVLSSDLAFNQGVSKEKEKNRMKEDKKSGKVYQYALAPVIKKTRFVNRFRSMEERVGASDIKHKPKPTEDEEEKENGDAEVDGEDSEESLDGEEEIIEEEGKGKGKKGKGKDKGAEEAPPEPNMDEEPFVPDAVKNWQDGQKKGKKKKKKDE